MTYVRAVDGRVAAARGNPHTASFNCVISSSGTDFRVQPATMINKEEPWPPSLIYTGEICNGCRYDGRRRPRETATIRYEHDETGATRHGRVRVREHAAEDVGRLAAGADDGDRVDHDDRRDPGSPAPTASRSTVLRPTRQFRRDAGDDRRQRQRVSSACAPLSARRHRPPLCTLQRRHPAQDRLRECRTFGRLQRVKSRVYDKRIKQIIQL